MHLFDWERAFGKISHEWLFKALEFLDIPGEILGVIRGLYKNPEFFYEIKGEASKIAKQGTGIRQGCSLSPYLFILVMDRIFEAIPHLAETHMKRVKIKGREAIGTTQGLTKSFRALL